MKTEEYTHPAFGIAQFRRVSGRPGNMFGSSVECEQFIELEIRPAGEEVNDITGTHYFADGRPYITVWFSPAQFADLITNMNIGEGIPCTVKDINGKDVEDIPDDLHENELDRQKRMFKEKLKSRADDLHNAQKRIEEILAKPNVGKADKEELKSVLFKAIQDVNSNIPFYVDQFQEATDGIVHEAKSEIDATIHHCVVSAGLKALGEEFKSHQRQIEDAEYQEQDTVKILGE